MKEIILFDKVLVDASRTNNHLSDFQTSVINKALQKGIIVSPRANMMRVNEYLDTLPNKMITLHPSFEAVRNTPKAVLYIQQLSHYMTTYGTNFSGEVYLPSWGRCDIDLNEFRKLETMTKDDVYSEIHHLIMTGLALSNEILDAIIVLNNQLELGIRSRDTNNKELAVRLMIENKETPVTTVEMMRIINYVLAGSTTIVKNAETAQKYRDNISENTSFVLDLFRRMTLERVSAHFNRYKILFLAMKRDGRMAGVINKISKLSKTYHMPMTVPFESKFLCFDYLKALKGVDRDDYFNALKILINKSTIFQLEKYARLVKKKIQALNHKPEDTACFDVYNIRNGKIFCKQREVVDDAYSILFLDFIVLKVKDMINTALKERLAEKLVDATVKVPAIDLALPTSMKDFVGHIPYGSSIDLGDWDSIQLGIHWTGEDCGPDLDLSLTCTDGRIVSWNTNQRTGDITHTGDMTSAQPEAAEIISITNVGIPQCSIVVNPYHCKPNGVFTFFIAKNADVIDHDIDVVDASNEAMSNKDNIIFSCQLNINGQLNIGYVAENKFYFSGRETGKGRVMTAGRWSNNMTIAEIQNMKCFTKFSEVYEDTPATAGSECIDLTTKDRTALVELLS